MTLDAYRSADNTAVDDDTARQEWSRAARPVLVQVARRFGALLAPSDLAEEVQALSGVRTRQPASLWIDDVLDAVGLECGERGEPLLSAFCVGPDGRIGDRYEKVVVSIDGAAPVDREMHAATQRLEAHQYHGATLPVDGGRPTLPPQLAKQRSASSTKTTRSTRPARAKAATSRRPKKPELPPRPVCPTCFLQLPATGRCDNCDE